MNSLMTRRRIRSVIMIAGAAALAVPTLPQVSMAQRDGTTTRTSSTERAVVQVRHSGEPEGVTWPDLNAPAPPSLTVAQLGQLMAPMGVVMSAMEGPWKVTPDVMTGLLGRIRLAFIEARSVTAALAVINGRPQFSVGQPTGAVLLRLRALAPGERYFIDCRVGPLNGTYRISGPGSTGTFTGDGHVFANYVAPDTNWVTYHIERVEPGQLWFFHACDISRVQ